MLYYPYDPDLKSFYLFLVNVDCSSDCHGAALDKAALGWLYSECIVISFLLSAFTSVKKQREFLL